MNGSCLLDTNIVIALLAGDKKVIKRLEKVSYIRVPVIVAGELYYGALNSGRPKNNIKLLDSFFKTVELINCDSDTAFNYAQIKKNLKDKGKPIPENDIWIAALSLQYSIPLASRDTHLTYIDKIVIEKW
jgi:tRNA(fMet)-specific endonuclease VapC